MKEELLEFVRVSPDGKKEGKKILTSLISNTNPQDAKLIVMRDVDGYHIHPEEGTAEYEFNDKYGQKCVGFMESLGGIRCTISINDLAFHFYRFPFQQ